MRQSHLAFFALHARIGAGVEKQLGDSGVAKVDGCGLRLSRVTEAIHRIDVRARRQKPSPRRRDSA